MIQRPQKNMTGRSAARTAGVLPSNHLRQQLPQGKRARGGDAVRDRAFVPPETWHEPSDEPSGRYRFVVQPAGEGYVHAVTPDEVRARLSEFPSEMLQNLEVVQFSRITRKKLTFPCYGMQWGNALYLYPIEDSLIEYYPRPPRPALRTEAEMFGGHWVQQGSAWKLIWTPETIKDFYLNNILIHELGHLLDQRNTSYIDRERFAEWFAIEHGYKPTQRQRLAAKAASRMVVKRHAKK